MPLIGDANTQNAAAARSRRYYVALRRHDGATDTEIEAEIPALDPEWHADYVLADGDLEKSLAKVKRVKCEGGGAKNSRRSLASCLKERELQRGKLREAGLLQPY